MVDNVGFSFHTPKGGKGSRSREQGPSFKLIAARRYAGLVVVITAAVPLTIKGYGFDVMIDPQLAIYPSLMRRVLGFLFTGINQIT